jgi:hypothetical protein
LSEHNQVKQQIWKSEDLPFFLRERQVFPAEIRRERVGNFHAAVGLEIVFQERGEHARDGQAGAVDGVNQLRLAVFATKADVRAAGLEGFEIRAA